MKNYIIFDKTINHRILLTIVLLILIINTNQVVKSTMIIHENLEDVILKGMKEIFSKMNVKYKYKEVINLLLIELTLH